VHSSWGGATSSHLSSAQRLTIPRFSNKGPLLPKTTARPRVALAEAAGAAKGDKVRLTEKETSLLRYLYRAGQRPVSRETLLQEVWGYNSGMTTHTVETHIYRLRQKIEKDAAAPAILVSEAGGYKLAS
jgi:DNA-binding response OmpR family regulator